MITIVGAFFIVALTAVNLMIFVKITDTKDRIYAAHKDRHNAEMKFLDTLTGWYMKIDGLMKGQKNG